MRNDTFHIAFLILLAVALMVYHKWPPKVTRREQIEGSPEHKLMMSKPYPFTLQRREAIVRKQLENVPEAERDKHFKALMALPVATREEIRQRRIQRNVDRRKAVLGEPPSDE